MSLLAQISYRNLFVGVLLSGLGFSAQGIAGQSKSDEDQIYKRLDEAYLISHKNHENALAELNDIEKSFTRKTPDKAKFLTYVQKIIELEEDRNESEIKTTIEKLKFISIQAKDEELSIVYNAIAATHSGSNNKEVEKTLLNLKNIAESRSLDYATWIVNLRLATIYLRSEIYEKSIAILLKSMEIVDKQRFPKHQSLDLIVSLGLNYLDMKDSQKFDYITKKGIETATELKSIKYLCILNMNSAVMVRRDASESPFKPLELAYNYCRSGKFKRNEVLALVNTSDAYLGNNNIKAEEYAKMAKEVHTNLNDTFPLALAYENLGLAQIGQGKIKEGDINISKSIELLTKLGYNSDISALFGDYSEMLEKNGLFKEALSATRKQQKLSAELFTADREKAVAKAQEQFNAKEREKQIEILSIENKNANLQIAVIVLAALLGVFVIGFVAVFHYRARTRAEASLVHRSLHDIITGLPNRRALESHIGEIANENQVLAVVSVERLQRVVATLGHEAGDEALRLVAKQLQDESRSLDAQVFHLDGANFALTCAARAGAMSLAAVVKKVAQKPLFVGSHEVSVGIVCGTARLPEDGIEANALLRNANTALEHAKRAQSAHMMYEPAFNERSTARLELEAALGHAVERGELELHYQVQMDIASDKIIGAEALVRWRRNGSLVSPGEFIPIAEESGVIIEIGEWVLREACRQSVEWTVQGIADFVIAVNISARQFLDPHFFDSVASALADTGVSPRCIELEITESAIMQDPQSVANDLARLRDMGLALAIDDFGTGYSSLAYLKRFPLDKLKVDQSFVRHLDVADTNGESAIVDAVIRLGHTLGLNVIAEGVESQAQLEVLRRLGCNEIQGYLLSKPVPAAQAQALIHSHTSLRP